MGPKGRLFAKEYAAEILKIGRADLQSARALAAAADPGRLETVLFLVQQAIEKAIKAVLCIHGQEIIHTHNLDTLLILLRGIATPPRHEEVGALTQYAMAKRYEEGREILSKADIDAALALGQDIVNWATLECIPPKPQP